VSENYNVLLVEPNPALADALETMLAGSGIECRVALGTKQAWESFRLHVPDAVLMDLALTDDNDGAWFARRLRDEFLGKRPRMVGLMPNDETPTPSVRDMGLDAVVLSPPSPVSLLRGLNLEREKARKIDFNIRHSREMIRFTSLDEGNFDAALASVARRVALLLGVRDCYVYAKWNEVDVMGSAVSSQTEIDRDVLYFTIGKAMECGAPLLVTNDGTVESYLAAPLRAADENTLGGICVIDRRPALFGPEVLTALKGLARRLASEVAARLRFENLSAEAVELRENALFDPGMKVLSRTSLSYSIRKAVSRSARVNEPICVAVFDIAGLNRINQRHGHETGDRVLQFVAEQVQNAVRDHDLVGRYGGDELAVMLSAAPLASTFPILQRVLNAIESKAVKGSDGMPIVVQASAGVALIEEDDEDGEIALTRAALAADTVDSGGIAIAGASETGFEARHQRTETGFGPGKVVGGTYKILHEISRGGAGVVYRAEDIALRRAVAIKALRTDLARDAEFLKRFKDEASILAQIHHPSLVQIYSFGVDKINAYFVMELVEGRAVSEVVEGYGTENDELTPGQVCRIVEQTAGALDALHRGGMVHRDVKPANVLLDPFNDRAVLVDVGIAGRIGASTDHAGTPGFSAPETMQGGDVTPAADVYGLATTTYTMLVGRAPFDLSKSALELIETQLEGPAPPPSTTRPHLAPADDLFARALAPSPEDRPRTPSKFADELTKLLEDVVPAEFDPNVSGSMAMSASRQAATPTASAGSQTRGLVFRCASRVLGVQRVAQLASELTAAGDELAAAMDPNLPPMAWVPSEQFVALLEHAPESDDLEFAEQLGRAVVRTTFKRFFPAERSTLSPSRVLTTVEMVWTRYHSWGHVEPRIHDHNNATVSFTNTLGSEKVCQWVAGMLGQVVTLTGGSEVTIEHPKCEARGDETCAFHIHWQEA